MKSNFDLWLPPRQDDAHQQQISPKFSVSPQPSMDQQSTKSDGGMSIDSDCLSNNSFPDATNDLFTSNDTSTKQTISLASVEPKQMSLFDKAKSFILPQSSIHLIDTNAYNARPVDEDSEASEASIEVSEDSVSYNHESPCPYGCKHCGASFDEVLALKKHLMRGHCRSRSSSNLLDGIESHSTNSKSMTKEEKKRRHKCLLCGKGFEFRWILRRHMKVHSGVKEFPCEICGKKFRHKSNVKVHMVKHSTTAKIHCDVCGKDFKWKASFKRHKCIKT